MEQGVTGTKRTTAGKRRTVTQKEEEKKGKSRRSSGLMEDGIEVTGGKERERREQSQVRSLDSGRRINASVNES